MSIFIISQLSTFISQENHSNTYAHSNTGTEKSVHIRTYRHFPCIFGSENTYDKTTPAPDTVEREQTFELVRCISFVVQIW